MLVAGARAAQALGSLAIGDALLALCLAFVFALVSLRERRPAALVWSVAWLTQPLTLLGLGLGGGGQPIERFTPLLAGLSGVAAAALVGAAWTEAGGRGSWPALLGSPALAGLGLAGVSVLLPTEWAPAFLALVPAAGATTAAMLLTRKGVRRGAGLRLASGAFLVSGLCWLAGSALRAGGFWPGPADRPAALVALATLTSAALGLLLARWEGALREIAAAQARLEEMRQRHLEQAVRDPLTGLVNRRAFRDLVDRVRGGTTTPHGCVIVLDMDGLKRINDTQGHSIGDKAIYRMARATESALRPGDLPIRWGGDEFVVVLPGASLAVAETLRDSIQAGVRREGLAASGGMALYGPDQDIVLALREADRLMYVAKRQHREGSSSSTLQLWLPLEAQSARPPYTSH